MLLLEKILEGLARVVGTPSGWSDGGRRSIVHRRCIFLDGHAKFKERAIIFRVFFRNAFGNRLGALKLLASVEVDALFAAVQFGMTPGTLATLIEAGHKDRAAT